MSAKRREKPLVEGLEITAIAAEGKAMGHHEGMVVFVPLTVPGDVVDVQIRTRRRRFMEGYVVRWVRRSELRAEPFCDHFGVCGGCSWQHLPYSEQLAFKRQQVVDQLSRIGHLELPAEGVRPAIGSGATTFYRNKLEFTFAPRRWLTYDEIRDGADIASEPALGFHVPGMFDKILDVRRCWLQPDPSNDIRLEIKRFCVERGYEFYNIREHSGLVRNIVIRTASTGEVMVIVVFAAPDSARIEALLGHVRERFPALTSLMWIVNDKLNDSLTGLQAMLHSGRDHIFEAMEGLRFKIGPGSFYQTNSAQAHELYKIARDYAGLTGGNGHDELSGDLPVVYDLYTGTGTIACFVAAGARKVVGIEYVEAAIEDARQNAAANGITNASFHAGDMKRVLTDEFIAAHGRPDVVILDPPRAGIDAPVVETILRAAPQTIVYVSCNPATQARDLALMAPHYRIAAVQPVDMFPHTHHVENVVKLIKRQP